MILDKEGDICPSIKKIINSYNEAMERKDPYTLAHAHHVKIIAETIWENLPWNFKSCLNKNSLSIAALLHDIGKLKVPEHILNKEGSLTKEEWDIIRQHAIWGKLMLDNTALECVGNWILYHHERIDGKGYYGLSGDEIPLASKIIAIADVFSALRTYRIYRSAKSIYDTIDIMKQASGTQLDAKILEIFLSLPLGLLAELKCNCEICRLRRERLKNMGIITYD